MERVDKVLGGNAPGHRNGNEKRSAVLCDPHPLWLGALELLLRNGAIDVLGATTSPNAALGLLDEHKPDVFVMDIESRDGSPGGIEIVTRARAEHPETKVIVLSAIEDVETIETALAAGAVSYILKAAQPEDLTSAVSQTFQPFVFTASASTGLSQSRVRRFASDAGLTRREQEILQLVSEGHSNGQLARILWVSEQTVKFHLSNIYRKLDVANRTEAARWAQLHGLLDTRTQAPASQGLEV